MTALFELDGVRLCIDGATVFDRVDLVIPRDGVTVIAGPSGAGKSTVLRMCNRLTVPTAGCVRFRGEDVSGLDPLQLRRRVGMVFQRPTLFPGTIAANLAVAAPQAGHSELRSALERAGLGIEFLDRSGDDLSGGEAQRACLARALLTQPEVLLMDEPTSSLDPANTRRLENLARELASDGVSIIWVSHDLEQVARLANRTFVLIAGRIADGADAKAFLAGEWP